MDEWLVRVVAGDASEARIAVAPAAALAILKRTPIGLN